MVWTAFRHLEPFRRRSRVLQTDGRTYVLITNFALNYMYVARPKWSWPIENCMRVRTIARRRADRRRQLYLYRWRHSSDVWFHLSHYSWFSEGNWIVTNYIMDHSLSQGQPQCWSQGHWVRGQGLDSRSISKGQGLETYDKRSQSQSH